jgi:hypothetical protein
LEGKISSIIVKAFFGGKHEFFFVFYHAIPNNISDKILSRFDFYIKSE